MTVRISVTDHNSGDSRAHGRPPKRPLNLTYSDKARENAAKARRKNNSKPVQLAAVPAEYKAAFAKLFSRTA